MTYDNQDFVTFSENYEKGRPRLEYALTLDKTSLLGLGTVLSSMISLKIKTLFAFHKKMKRNGRTQEKKPRIRFISAEQVSTLRQAGRAF